MPRISPALGALSVAALVLGACADSGPRQQAGTGVGAAVGGLVGAAVSGSDPAERVAGALIGAAVGGAIGAGIGRELDRQADALKNDLAGTGATVTNTGDQLVVNLPESITFAFNSAAVQPRFQGSLAAIAQNLNQFPNSRIDVIGHTDNVGTNAVNQQLSQQRASAVAGELIRNGVSAARIRAFGVGESQPIASNATEAGRQQNRRVEIVIIPTG